VTFDVNKPLSTRDGREVRIYETDRNAAFPIAGAFKNGVGEWSPLQWRADGKYVNDSAIESSLDLVNKPEPRKVLQWPVQHYKTLADVLGEQGYVIAAVAMRELVAAVEKQG